MKKFLYFLYARFLKWKYRIVMKRGNLYYINYKYKRLFGSDADLESPKTFAEKIQWLKLNDHNPKIVEYADKYAVREHIKNTIGEEYLIPLIASWESAEEIDFDLLPNSFVIKPNNSSGRVLICKDKRMLDYKKAYKKIKKWEKENLTEATGEWFYEKIPFKIVCEEFLEDDISDYKMYFADGQFICTQLIAGRHSHNKTFTYYDENWNKLDIVRYGMPKSSEPQEKPEKYEEMLTVATKLAEDFNFMRVDLYYVNNRIYFGELSFYPNNGFVRYQTDEMDEFFSSKIHLPIDREFNDDSKER